MMVLIILTAAGILAMFASVFNGRSVVLPVSLSGLFAAGYFALLEWNTNTTYFEAMRMDNFAIAFTVVCLFAAFVFLLLYHYMHYSSDVHHADAVPRDRDFIIESLYSGRSEEKGFVVK